jgi:cell wall-associated NlpC family hydrolase
MLRRVNPVVLISLITVLILSIAIFAVANTGGGRDAALGAATGQVGMPYGFGTDGPGSFSCTGLVRHALRSAGVDPNAPWDHMAYLGAYPTVSEPQPGDVVVYPDGAAMYVGNGQVVMANHADGVVGLYGMNEIGTPVGFANPYGGAVDPAMSDPAAVQPAGQMPVDQGMAPPPIDQGMGAPIDQGLTAPVDPGLVPAGVNQYLP